MTDNQEHLEIPDNSRRTKDYKPNYYAYIASKAWADKKEQFRKTKFYRGGKCFVCTNARVPIHIHHINYYHLGNERMCDLRPLCFVCHAATHNRFDDLPSRNPNKRRKLMKCTGMRKEWYAHASRRGLWRLRWRNPMEYAYAVAAFFGVLNDEMVESTLRPYRRTSR